jgi:LPS O-antigen subunit length determinant protein (WzzB/FepE family)
VPQATTNTGRKSTKSRATSQSKALVGRLTDAGEDALQRIVELPGGHRALGAFNDLRTRVDELGKKVRGIDALERRIAKLEKQVAELKAPRKTTTRRTATRRTPPRASS